MKNILQTTNRTLLSLNKMIKLETCDELIDILTIEMPPILNGRTQEKIRESSRGGGGHPEKG